MITFTSYNPLAGAVGRPISEQVAIEADNISHVSQAEERRCKVHLKDGREFVILEGLQDISQQVTKWREHMLRIRVLAEKEYEEKA